MRQRYLIHLMTGGLGHGLHYFGNSVAYAEATGRRVVPCFEANEAFASPFHEVFDIDERIVCPRAESEEVLRVFGEELGSRGPVSLASLGRLPGHRHGPTLAVAGEVVPYGGAMHLPNFPRPVRRFLVTDGELSHSSGSRGKFVNAWLNIRVRQATGLLRSLMVLRIKPESIVWARTLAPTLNKGYVGVHFRNTDRRSDLDHMVKLCRAACAERGLADVYWATDDKSSVAKASGLLPEMTIHNLARLPVVNQLKGENVHYLPQERLAAIGATKRDLLNDTLGDVFMLSQASEFLGHEESALSRMVSFVRSDRRLAESFLGCYSP